MRDHLPPTFNPDRGLRQPIACLIAPITSHIMHDGLSKGETKLILRAFASDSVAGRRLALITLISLALVMPAMWPSTARAEDGSSKPNVPVSHLGMTDEERAQVPLVKAADELQALAEKHALPGFAGVAIQIDKRSVELFWKGTVPGVLGRAITKLRGSVAVSVTPAAYSLAELIVKPSAWPARTWTAWSRSARRPTTAASRSSPTRRWASRRPGERSRARYRMIH